MGCYLQYGAYVHAENECSYTVSKSVVENDAGQPYAEENTWTISGTVGNDGDPPGIVAAKFTALERAYAFWGRDLAFKDESGLILQQLRSAGSLTGTRIVQPPHNPVGEGAEFRGYRNYTIVVSARYPMTGAYGGGGFILRSFKETVTFSGGGPRRTVVECVNAPPQDQVLATHTAFRAVQQGQAVGIYGYPAVPAPLFPAALETAPQITRGSPLLRNGNYTDYEISWSYSYVSALPLIGTPNVWPAG